ncbi:MAG: hypothetical protein QOI66_2333 [Myxococcales bacterium]|nr:hypothetical protein [Myxococcales bacterium]
MTAACKPRNSWRLTSMVVAGVSLALVGPGGLVLASDGKSGSQSNNSSQGSGDSSNNSNASSKNSNDSSKSSNNSTQNSPKNSSDWSTQGTTDQTSKSHGAHVFWAASAVVVLGASAVVGTILVVRATDDHPQQRTAAALATFMRQNHALLTHDVAVAGGPLLDAWARDLGLSSVEKRQIAVAMEGSSEQGALLAALDGAIDERRAQSFSIAFFGVTARALGPARTQGLVARAASTTQRAQ